jgi:glutamate-1-semialdehyde 2,1-aminomutase
MSWMTRWPGPFPLFVERAEGARFVDVDGHEYVDFCLGDTGAMFGHANPAVVDAVSAQLARGCTTMLASADSAWVGEEQARRIGLQPRPAATSARASTLRLSCMVLVSPRNRSAMVIGRCAAFAIPSQATGVIRRNCHRVIRW